MELIYLCQIFRESMVNLANTSTTYEPHGFHNIIDNGWCCEKGMKVDASLHGQAFHMQKNCCLIIIE